MLYFLLNVAVALYVLLQSKNKVSLRNLSMVMRQLEGNPEERQALIKESVERAKDAVQLDLADGTSWCEFLESDV